MNREDALAALLLHDSVRLDKRLAHPPLSPPSVERSWRLTDGGYCDRMNDEIGCSSKRSPSMLMTQRYQFVLAEREAFPA
jgi:hypothetical protein